MRNGILSAWMMRREFEGLTLRRSEALDGQLAGVAGVWRVDCRAADADVGEAVVEHRLSLVHYREIKFVLLWRQRSGKKRANGQAGLALW